jgi:hypothetical protein
MQTTQSRYNSLVAAGIPTPEARYEATLEPDFAFDITTNPEPDQASGLYFVRMYDPATLETLDRFTTDDPYRGWSMRFASRRRLTLKSAWISTQKWGFDEDSHTTL